MNIAIANDHAGVAYKEAIASLLETNGHKVINFGTDNSESTDYPDYAHPLANAVSGTDADFGVLICGSGNGVCMTANKHQNVRAALCWNNQIATLSRLHNNANVICIPARFVAKELAAEMVNTFLNTEFAGGRHERRVGKICI